MNKKPQEIRQSLVKTRTFIDTLFMDLALLSSIVESFPVLDKKDIDIEASSVRRDLCGAMRRLDLFVEKYGQNLTDEGWDERMNILAETVEDVVNNFVNVSRRVSKALSEKNLGG